MKKTIYLVSLLLGLTLFSCDEDNNVAEGFEEAGEDITDDTGERLEEGFEEAGETMDNADEQLEEGFEDAGEGIEELGDDDDDEMPKDSITPVEIID